jgi:hypothetical protein
MSSIPAATKWQRQLLVDDAMDAYLEWREESIAVWDAYGCWTSAGSDDISLAYGAYAAALDREERASEVYADRIRGVRELVTTDGS